MRRLLLLLILFPAVVFGQTRRKDVIDSIKTATERGLHRVSALSGNGPGSRVENVDVRDSGEYVTVVVRVRLAEKLAITAAPALPITNIRVEYPAAGNMNTIPVPALPPPVIWNEKMDARSIAAIISVSVTPAPPDGLKSLPVPALPPPVSEQDTIDALPSYFVMKTFPVDFPFIKRDTAIPPALPEVVSEMDAMTISTAVKLTIDLRSKMDTIPAVSFAEKKMPVEEMHLSDEGYSLLEKLEGFSPELYSLKDGGFTIGFGFFIPYGEGAKWEKGVTWEEAERLIRQKVPQYEDQVKKYINVPLTQNEFDALTMLAYNLGGFSKATSIVNDINGQADFYKLRSDWNRFVHSKAPGVTKGLMNRRKDELGVKKTANYQPERKIQIFKIKK